MNLTSLITGLGSIGPFASRIFLPALLTALLIRFGGDIPIVGHMGLLGHVHHQPAWFTSNASLIALTVLSVLEILAQKNPEARHLLQEFDTYLKSALSFLTSVGVINATDAGFARETVHQAGFLTYMVPLLVALGTFHVASIRRDVMRELFDHVEGTHFDHLLTWLEDAWAVFGVFLLVLFPLLMLLLVGIAIGALVLVRRRLEALEHQTRIPCRRCGKEVYPSAMACPACREAVEHPCAVGFLGHSKPYPDEDLTSHPYRLIEKRRCPVCATHLRLRVPRQNCPACNEPVMADPEAVSAFASYIGRRVPVVLGVSFLMSLVPIVGLIVGVVYYRMQLVLPFSQYLPLGRRFLLRWSIRLLFLVLVFFQVVPLLGGLVVPLMAFISYTAYRASFESIALEPMAEGAPVAAADSGV